MTAPIADLLARIDAPGTFAARWRAPADDLEVKVTGVGPLTFPITPRLAQRLRGVARPSPFGLREQTLHDKSVRDTWEVASSRVKIAARRWKPALARHLQTIQRELGLPEEGELEAVFDKLLLYGEGQFFKPHQDSEKDDERVGTLVVILPSTYGGGAVTVEHRGEKKVFRRVESQARDLSLLAFYADCHHSVSPLASGVRVALTYQLRYTCRATRARPSLRADLVDGLVAAVGRHFTEPVVTRYGRSEPAPPERLVYLLDHEYTQRSLSWSRLKNTDRARVAALGAAAERLDCEVFLALAEVHETWMCEDDEPRRGYWRRGWRSYASEPESESESESKEHELIELQDSSVVLSHWLDVGEERIDGIPGPASDEELCFTKPSRDMDPFESKHEGYQGNYGNTVDRWYHRAALVMWPRANTFALRAQASPKWAVDELLALPRSATAELESRVRSLLPRWRRTAGSVSDARFFSRLMKVSERIADAELAMRWLAPLGLHRLTRQSMRRDLAVLVDKHGVSWAQALVQAWTTDASWRTPAWVPLLADLCAELHGAKSAACAALAQWLLQRELQSALQRCAAACKRVPPWLDLDSFGEEASRLAHVLAAAAAISADAVITDTLDALRDGEPSPPLALLVQVLQACLARSPALAARVRGSVIHRECVARLRVILRASARAEGEWAIRYPLGCGCADCQVLALFLGSGRVADDWPLNKERRQHIHGVIDSARLPVLHTTLRRGSPHVLQLRKDPSLFARERAHRSRVQAILDALPAAR